MIHLEPWYKSAGREQDITALERTFQAEPRNYEVAAQLLVTLHRYGMLADWLHKHLFAGLRDQHFDTFRGLWSYIKDAPTSAMPKEVWAEVYGLFRKEPQSFIDYAWDLWFKHKLYEILGGYFPNFTWKELSQFGTMEHKPHPFVQIEVTGTNGVERREVAAPQLVRGLSRPGWEFANGEFSKPGPVLYGSHQAKVLTPEALPQILQWIAEARASQ